MDELQKYKFLYEICSMLIKAQEDEERFRCVIENMCKKFEGSACSLWIADSSNDLSLHRISYYQQDQSIKDFLPTLDFKVANFVIRNRQSLICYELQNNSGFGQIQQKIRVNSHLLYIKGEIVGLLSMWCSGEKCSDCENDSLLQQLLNEIATALYNYKFYSNVQGKRLKRELEIARNIQSAFLPKNIPDIKGITIAARSLAANEVGGDYIDLFLTKQNNLGIAIGDVMGKGIPAALWSAVTRATLRMAGQSDVSPQNVLREVNSLLYEDLAHQEMFVTLLYAWYEPVKSTLLFSNAGHYSPILIRKESREYKTFKLKGSYIGGIKNYEYQASGLRLQQGDIVLFYTDGLIEAVNSSNEQFGVMKLFEVVKRNFYYKAPELLDIIFLHIGQHIGDHRQVDDMSCILLKVEE